MSRLAPVLILCATFACGYYIFVQDAIDEASTRFKLTNAEIDARRAAEAGYVRGAEYLYESFSDTSFGGTYVQDSFRVNVDVVGNKAIVSSLGLAQRDSVVTDHIVRVEFVRSTNQPVDTLQFMQFAIFAGNRLHVADSLVVTSLGRINPQTPVVHANGRITVNHADRILTESAAGAGRDWLSSSRRTRAATTPIEVGGLYGDGVRLAPHSHSDGDLILSGAIGDGATARSPFIWHVEGDLIIAEDVVANGYVLILVDGNVAIRASLRGRQGEEPLHESMIGIHAAGSIAIVEPVTVEAQLYAGADAIIRDSGATVRGSITARGSVEILGPTKVDYRRSSPALMLNWVNPVEKIALLSYDEQ